MKGRQLGSRAIAGLQTQILERLGERAMVPKPLRWLHGQRNRWSPAIGGGICLLMLGLPLLYPLTRDRDRTYIQTVEQRPLSAFPDRPSWRDWLYRGTYQQLNAYLADRLPLRSTFIQTKGTLERQLFEQNRNRDVDLGGDGWLFYRNSYGLRDGQDGDRYTPERVDYALESLRRYLAWQTAGQTRAQLRIAIAPSKHTLYPEHLPPAARRDLNKTQVSRDRLHQALINSPDPRLVDLWSAYRSAKPQISQRLYYREDTHHTPRGALVMVEALVNAFVPQRFATARLVARPGDRVETGDLRRMLGLAAILNDPSDPVYSLERPRIGEAGVETDRGRFATVADAIAQDQVISDRNRRFVLHYRSGGDPLVPGRTLVVGDSFMHPLALGPFFESAEFYHHNVLPQNLLMAAPLTYDQILLQRVERLALSFLETLPRLGDPLGWWRSNITPTLWSATPRQPASVRPLNGTELERRGDRWIVSGPTASDPPRLLLPVPPVRAGKTYVLRLAFEAQRPGQAQLYYPTGTRRGDAAPMIRVNFAAGAGELFFLVQSVNVQPDWHLTWEKGTEQIQIDALELRELP
ncbi:MAG: hypothetical protein MH825_12280 [Cyanobacteria bacterium]|nr:hypothetical protein [Cyanobacteriota bacterium]